MADARYGAFEIDFNKEPYRRLAGRLDWACDLYSGVAGRGGAGSSRLVWAVTTSVWTAPAKALGTASKAYAGLGGDGALAATYVKLLLVLTASTKRFAARSRRSRFCP
jgi:hypothetical protein